jgi:hypothetical protein
MNPVQSVKYSSIDDAVEMIQSLGKGPNLSLIRKPKRSKSPGQTGSNLNAFLISLIPNLALFLKIGSFQPHHINMELRLPSEQLQKLQLQLDHILHKDKITLLQLQSL